MESFSNDLFVEKYRPKKISDCILSPELKTKFEEFIAKGDTPNLLLAGTQGTGKTTVCRAIASQLGADVLFINASNESGIDTVREKIIKFASTSSLHGAMKIIILDEADFLNPSSSQPALRGVMEQYSENCRFFLTCNFINKIITPLHSRCSVIEFKFSKADKVPMMQEFHKRIVHILKEENIKCDDQKVLVTLISKYFPDFRRILNEIQRYSASGHIDTGIFENLSETNFGNLMKILKEKKWSEMRKWVALNSDSDSTVLFREIYENMSKYIEGESLPGLVVTLARYQSYAAFAVDSQINICGFLTEVMADAKFI